MPQLLGGLLSTITIRLQLRVKLSFQFIDQVYGLIVSVFRSFTNIIDVVKSEASLRSVFVPLLAVTLVTEVDCETIPLAVVVARLFS